MSAFPGVSSYQSSSLGSKFVVIGVVCCQEMRRYALFHKVLPGLTKYFSQQIAKSKLFLISDKLWNVMKENGFSTHQLREKCGVDSKTIRRLRANDNMETKTLNKLCTVLDCRLEDIAEYIPDEQ
ncbi:helix-turn-helix transcriptional regulator [Oscillibacter sp. CU971]|uniref:helix-turn-helix domain-containing protein n=1 Tax=Oscillibacter sp. CU971 TaxID=2780102 RepID=UPI00195E45E7|nr:helix-turn-helix transcriptional regulator [Oscillibacter sp. CU971]